MGTVPVPEQVSKVELGPLSVAALFEFLTDRLGTAMPRPLLPAGRQVRIFGSTARASASTGARGPGDWTINSSLPLRTASVLAVAP